MNRLTIYAHFDAQREIKRYVAYCLEQLRTVSAQLVFASTAGLDAEQTGKVRPLADEVRLSENVGFDFGMWRDAILHAPLAQWDEICLVNSSVFGPVFPLEPILRAMANEECDAWGMTENLEIRPHAQSYFLVFKRGALASPAFLDFWRNVQPSRDKSQVIGLYEVGLTRFLTEHGLRVATFVPTEKWVDERTRRRMRRRARWNPTIHFPLELLRGGSPFVKVELLRDNPGGVPLSPVRAAMRASGYDMSLVEFDRPAVGAPRSFVRQLANRLF